MSTATILRELIALTRSASTPRDLLALHFAKLRAIEASRTVWPREVAS
jgi:hypothetical protein